MVKQKLISKAAPKREAAKKTTKTKAAPKRTAAKNKGMRGKRYSDAAKQKIIAFVEAVNAKKGRGGVSAAAKKFSVSPLSISNWIKGGGKPSAGAKRGPRKAASGGVLEQLVALKSEIDDLEGQIASKRAKFDTLKRKL